MKCRNCNAEIPDDVLNCPYCDTSQDSESVNCFDNNKKTIQSQVQNQFNNQTIQNEPAVNEELIGKRYEFRSSYGMNMWGILNPYILSEVEIAKDRIFIDIKPKRKNTSPVVMLEDILSVELSKTVAVYHTILAMVFLVASLSSILYGLGFILFIYLGLNTKIKIIQRNGIEVTMFSSNSELAENFKFDIRKMTNIR